VYLTFKTLSSLRGKQVVHYRTEKETAFPEKMGMKSRGCIIKMILFFLVGGAYAFRGRGGGDWDKNYRSLFNIVGFPAHTLQRKVKEE
jgi:hypothetical protein